MTKVAHHQISDFHSARQIRACTFAPIKLRQEKPVLVIVPETGKDDYTSWPKNAYQWHSEGFSLASGARQLARGMGHFECQAFAYGHSAYGFQFHPEVTFSTLNTWTRRCPSKLTAPGAKPRASHVSDHLKFSGDVKFWLENFLSHTFQEVYRAAAA